MITERVPLLRKQYEMLAYRKKWGAARGGVGAGKTVGWAYWLVGRMEEYPKASHFVIGADYEQLRRGFFETFRSVLEKHGWEEGRHFSYRAMPSPMLTFKHNGARLRALSSELAQRIRSVEFQSVVLEEPQTWDRGKDVFEVILGRLRHSDRSSSLYGDSLQPQGRMSFNPPAMSHWLYDLMERKWPAEGYKCWQMSVRQNVLLRGRDEFVKQLEATMSPERVSVEIDGNWATIGGNVYLGFNRKEMSREVPGLPAIALNPEKPLLWTMDFNVHKMCSVVAQVHVQKMISLGFDHADNSRYPKEIKRVEVEGWQRRIFTALESLVVRNAGSRDVAQAFIAKYGDVARKTMVYLYGDPAGGARAQSMSAQSAVWSAWDAILEEFDRAGIRYEIRVPTKAPSVGNRINAVKDQFKTGSGCGFRIDPALCGDLCTDLEMVSYKPGTNDVDKLSDPELTHSSDALGYMIWVERELEKDPHLEFKRFHYMER